MKKILVIIGAVVVIAILGYAYYYTTSLEENTFASNFGEWKIELYANMEDGTQIPLTGSEAQSLDVTYDGQPYTSLTYKLKGKASTPQGSEPFDTCELNTGDNDYQIDAFIQTVGQGTNIHDATDETVLTANTGFDVDDTYHEFYSYTYNFGPVFDSSVPGGTYRINLFQPTYTLQYRGITGQPGDSDYSTGAWKDAGSIPDLYYDVEWSGSDLNMNFDHDVIWS